MFFYFGFALCIINNYNIDKAKYICKRGGLSMSKVLGGFMYIVQLGRLSLD